MACIYETNDLTDLFEQLKSRFEPIFDGELHRFGDKYAGWFVCHNVGKMEIIICGDFSRTGYDSYQYCNRLKTTRIEKEIIARKVAEARDKQARAKRQDQLAARDEALAIRDDHSVEPLEFDYFVRKKIPGFYGAISHKGIVHIPMRDENGNLWAYQRLFADGDKRFFGRVKGLRHIIGEQTKKILLCEGFSTGVSLHISTELQVIVCFNAGNLVNVAESLPKSNDIEYIICADNDHRNAKNTGIEAAQKAQLKTGIKYVYPIFSEDDPSTDFNDLYIEQGATAVCNIVNPIKALTEEPIDTSTMFDCNRVDPKYKSYVTKFEDLPEIKRCRKDFLTKRVVYWSFEDECFMPILDELKSIRSLSDGSNLDTMRVSDNLERYCRSLPSRWLFDVPAWDGIDRIGWMCSFVKPSKVSGAVFENFMKAWFANIFMRIDDNRFHNFLPILQSNIQKMGKSFWIELITSGFSCYYGKCGETNDEKNILMTCGDKLILNFDEFDKFHALHPGFLKNLISTTQENYRSPYDRFPRDHKIKTSFIGSCNREDFLQDTTGNKRFAIFHLDSIDHGYGEDLPVADKIQIVAQARALYAEKYKIAPENKALMDKIVEQLSPDDPMDSALDEWEIMVSEAIALDGPNAQKYITSPQASQIWEVICRRNGIKIKDFQALLKRTGRTVRIKKGNHYYPSAKS